MGPLTTLVLLTHRNLDLRRTIAEAPELVVHEVLTDVSAATYICAKPIFYLKVRPEAAAPAGTAVLESPQSPQREIGEERDELMGARGYRWNTKDDLRRIQMCTCVENKEKGRSSSRENKQRDS